MKEKIINFFKKYYFSIICIFIIFIMTLIIIFDLFLYFKIDNKKENVVTEKKIVLNEEKTIENKSNVKVEIKGMVVNPGVYDCDTNSRVIDVINLAGGLIDGANTELINLSKKVTDEMIIIIYSNDFINNYRENNKKIEYVYIEIEKCPDQINDACINSDTILKPDEKTQEKNETTENIDKNENLVESNDSSIISINSANLEQLKTLSGIGTSKAEAIISYREKNGNFKAIEELKNVSGIGDAMFEKIKDNITI